MERMKYLVSLLNKANKEYYMGDKPIMTDKEYDDLYDELVELEKKHNTVYANSPTRNVGYEVVSSLDKVEHSHPMLSLDKTKDVKELLKFKKKKDCILSCKLDGLTSLVSYKHGVLHRIETRGNGVIGEDVTHNASAISNIPFTIPIKEDFEVEGEVIITYEDFEKINKQENNKYKNPRNLASGSLRQFDSDIAKERKLQFIAWKMPDNNIFDSNSYLERLEELKNIGFTVAPFEFLLNLKNNEEDINVVIDKLKNEANEKSYPIDGLVMTYDDIQYGKRLGMTAKFPRHSIAFKFYDDLYETKLHYIDWTMGKTGQITPVAKFEPVKIDGTIVEKASLHNVSILEELDLNEGDMISVYKANAIIPQVKENLSLLEKGERIGIMLPDTCPVCGGDVEVRNDNGSKVLICLNENCDGKLLGKMSHFVSKNGFDINGLSEETLKKFIELGWIKEFSDIFKLHEKKKLMLSLEKMGSKSVDKLLNNIEKARYVDLDKFISALSIPLVGSTVSKDIAEYCNYDIETFMNTKSFSKLDGIGEKMNSSIRTYFLQNSKSIEKLLSEITIKEKVIEETTNILSEKTFVITGKVNRFKNREEVKKFIEKNGGKVVSSINKNTSYLINNDVESNSSKNKKAKLLQIPILNEEELVGMVDINVLS